MFPLDSLDGPTRGDRMKHAGNNGEHLLPPEVLGWLWSPLVHAPSGICHMAHLSVVAWDIDVSPGVGGIAKVCGKWHKL